MNTQKAVRSYIWDEVETISPQDMEKLQVERLRACVEGVSKAVPFYKEKLSEAGVTADKIRSLEDLAAGSYPSSFICSTNRSSIWSAWSMGV